MPHFWSFPAFCSQASPFHPYSSTYVHGVHTYTCLVLAEHGALTVHLKHKPFLGPRATALVYRQRPVGTVFSDEAQLKLVRKFKPYLIPFTKNQRKNHCSDYNSMSEMSKYDLTTISALFDEGSLKSLAHLFYKLESTVIRLHLAFCCALVSECRALPAILNEAAGVPSFARKSLSTCL